MENMDESSPDIKGFNLKPANTSNPVIIQDEGPSFDKDAMYYDMSGEKYLIIINQHTFQKTIYFKNKQPSTRDGTDKDVKSLKSLFESLGFKVIVFNDLDYTDIIGNMTKFTRSDHTRTSCVCVAVLTHGDKLGEVYAAERPYLLNDVLAIFKQSKGLVNKPKLFFIQACRGENVDAGNTVYLDSETQNVLTVPSHADFLVLCSTVEDYLSYRDKNGSWMIQALCHIINQYHEEMDLLQMIILMNRKVAYERTTYTPYNKNMDNKKQMPETRFTLTKLVKF